MKPPRLSETISPQPPISGGVFIYFQPSAGEFEISTQQEQGLSMLGDKSVDNGVTWERCAGTKRVADLDISGESGGKLIIRLFVPVRPELNSTLPMTHRPSRLPLWVYVVYGICAIVGAMTIASAACWYFLHHLTWH